MIWMERKLHVWPDVGLVVCEHSWYASVWQGALTTVFRVTSCSRTNTDSVLYLFLTCTRPPDSTRNKYREDITCTQELSQSQSQNVSNQLVISTPLHLIIYAHPWSEYIRERIYCRDLSDSYTEWILIPSLVPRCVGMLITIYNLYFSRSPWTCYVDIVSIEIYFSCETF